MRIILVLMSALIAGRLTAQNSNGYLFIEPNISLKYDSALLKQKDRYTNPVYGTETYGFSYNFPARIRSSVQISTGLPPKNADQRYQDSVANALIKQMNRYAGDSIAIKGTRPFRYKNFQGYAFITSNKKRKESTVVYSCTRFLDGGFCKIYYLSAAQNAITGFDQDSLVITGLIDGIEGYSKQDFEKETELLKQKYTIVVDSIGRPQGFSSIEANYFCMLKVKGKLENTIQSVDMGYQSFFPDYKNEVLIYCNDAEKGLLEKKGDLILLTKVGKQVRLPFKFTYYNK
jgi:hypothetical protein